jgi:hypothetical protein
MKEATPEQIVAFLTGQRTKDVEAEVVLEQLRVQWEAAKREAETEIERLKAEIKQLRDLNELLADQNGSPPFRAYEAQKAEIERCRMLRVKLWDALRELADLVKDEC